MTAANTHALPQAWLPLDAVQCHAVLLEDVEQREVHTQAGNLAATRAFVQLPPLPCSPCWGTQAGTQASTHTDTHTLPTSFP